MYIGIIAVAPKDSPTKARFKLYHHVNTLIESPLWNVSDMNPGASRGEMTLAGFLRMYSGECGRGAMGAWWRSLPPYLPLSLTGADLFACCAFSPTDGQVHREREREGERERGRGDTTCFGKMSEWFTH